MHACAYTRVYASTWLHTNRNMNADTQCHRMYDYTVRDKTCIYYNERMNNIV